MHVFKGFTGKIILITSAAGFIGANLAIKLFNFAESFSFVGIDSMNNYYDVSLKDYRRCQIEEVASHSQSSWTLVKGDISNKELIKSIFAKFKPDIVVNLAAQVGVRYLITNPDLYIETNLFDRLVISES